MRKGRRVSCPEEVKVSERGAPTLKGGSVGGAASVWKGVYQLLGGGLSERGFPLCGKEGPALKGTPGGREGLAEEDWAWGEGS